MSPRSPILLGSLTATLLALAVACGDETETSNPPIPPGGGEGGTAGGLVGGGGTGQGGGGSSQGGGGSGGSGGIDYEVEACTDSPTASPGDAVCAVTAGDDRLFIVGDVLTPGRVYEQGGVLVGADGWIDCVGCGCVAEAAGATAIICPDAVVSAGLINAHDHVGWMNGVPWVAADEGVDPALRWEHRNDWRRGRRGHPTIDVAGGGASVDEKIFGELRFVLSGATAIFGSGDLGGLLRDLDDTGDGSNGLGQPGADYNTFPLGDSSGTQLEAGCADYNPTTTAASYYGCSAPHVSEGIDDVARNELHCLTGYGTGSANVLDGRYSIIHGIGYRAQEVGYLAAKGIGLVWSPRSNVSLYGDTAPVTLYDRLGVAIGLGTDWLPSGSMSMLRELACAASLNDTQFGGYFSDHKLWQMATVGAARVLRFDSKTGSLAQSLAGDIAIYANDGHEHYGSVVRAEVENVALVLRGGEVLSGNDAVVSSLESNCEVLEVCGVAKRVCVSRDTGRTLAAIEASANPPYPLFFCDTPEDEPTCLPARPLANDSVDGSTTYSGTSTATDPDGDGLDDGADNCPDIFNPARPVDHGEQADWDGDGEGDVCDRCPFDADTDVCVIEVTTTDRDADTVPDASDNCPVTPNSDQADTDDDDKGNACDECPTVSNPGAAQCPGIPIDIFAIQDETDQDHPTVGTRVSVGCIVTAVSELWAWCQDPLGGPYSGIAIFVGSAPMLDDGVTPLALGHDVTVEGTYEEFYQLSRLTSPTFSYVGTQPVPVPELVTASSVATGGALAEQYESVLIRVDNVAVTVVNPDSPSDYDEFAVTGNLRVDDQIIDGGGTGGDLDNSFTVGTAFSRLVGVLTYSYSHFKLLPRSPQDLQQGAPSLAGFDPSEIWVEVGGDVLPTDLLVTLTGLAAGDTVVDLQSSAPGIATVPVSVTIPDGTDRIVVPVTGVAPQAAPITITATLNADTELATAHVYDDSLPRAIVSIEPATATFLVSSAHDFTVTLDLPAASGGSLFDVLVTGGIGTAGAQHTVAAGQFSTDFLFTAAAAAASGTVVASLGASNATADVAIVAQAAAGFVINEIDYDQASTDYGEFVEIYNGTLSTINLTGYELIFVNGATTSYGDQYRTVDLGAAGSLAAGQFLVVHSPGVEPAPGALSLQVLPTTDGIQNGAPDGLALVSATALVDTFAYEGPMASVNLGAPYGTVDLHNGTAFTTADPNGTAGGSLCRKVDGVDTSVDSVDWTTTTTVTPGTANVIQ